MYSVPPSPPTRAVLSTLYGPSVGVWNASATDVRSAQTQATKSAVRFIRHSLPDVISRDTGISRLVSPSSSPAQTRSAVGVLICLLVRGRDGVSTGSGSDRVATSV